MKYATFPGENAHLYGSGKDAEVTYEGFKLPVTIINHDGRYGVHVTLKSPVLKVIVCVEGIKDFLHRKPLEKKEVELITELHLFEKYVNPL